MTTDVISIRASSLGELMDCAHRWEGKHLLGMRGSNSAPAWLGTSIHAGTAVFDTHRLLKGDAINKADFDEAIETFVNTLHDGKDIDWRYSDISKKTAEQTGIVLTTKYCHQISPSFNFLSVEMETKPYDIDVDGVVIRLTGTLDRSRTVEGSKGAGISDLKSGGRAVDKETGQAYTKGHAAQIGIYELLSEHTNGIPITEPAMIIGLQTKGAPIVGTGLIHGAKEQVLGNGDERGLIEYAAMYIKTGMFPPNPKSQLCSEKFCPRWSKCKFKE